MNRGSRAAGRLAVRSVRRFNEAPIHESGKLEEHTGTDWDIELLQ